MSVQSNYVYELAKTTVHLQMDYDNGLASYEVGDLSKQELLVLSEDYKKSEEKLGKAFLKLSGKNQVLLWGRLKELNFEHILDGF